MQGIRTVDCPVDRRTNTCALVNVSRLPYSLGFNRQRGMPVDRPPHNKEGDASCLAARTIVSGGCQSVDHPTL